MDSIPQFVYELVDPRDQSIFYVGITIDLYARYRQHMHCDGTNAQKDRRVQDILSAGHLPIMHTIEHVPVFASALERESFWIHRYLSQGIALLNIASVPSDLTKPYARKYKAAQIQTKQLFFRTSTGSVVSVWEAKDEEFDEFIKRYLEVEGELDWQNYQRRRFIAHALNDGIQMDFC